MRAQENIRDAAHPVLARHVRRALLRDDGANQHLDGRDSHTASYAERISRSHARHPEHQILSADSLNGSLRTRLPLAAKIALQSAGSAGG